MLIALTHSVSESITRCELTFIEREPIDYELALRQHAAYCDALRQGGANVRELTDNNEYPDSCFVEDTAVVLDELAVIARMGAESRRGEVDAIERFLAEYREIQRIDSPGTLDGGDIIAAGRTIFAGLSPRTNATGIESLAAIVEPRGYEVCPVAMRDCLHLKSACTPIAPDTLLANPNWVDLSPFGAFRVVTVDKDEPWAANALPLGDWVFLASAFERTAEKVESLGFTVRTLDISEYLKAEAGLTCSSIIFDAGATQV